MQINRPTDKHRDRHADMHTCKHTEIQPCKHVANANKQTNRHTDIQTYRHTDIHVQTYILYMQIYRHTDTQTYKHRYLQTFRKARMEQDQQTDEYVLEYFAQKFRCKQGDRTISERGIKGKRDLIKK